MSLSGKKLSDLPPHLLSNILAFLSPPFVGFLKPSIESVNSLTKELPIDLLAAANSSHSLREATIHVLASRAQILNAATASPMWEWIAALRDTVNAVSLDSSFALRNQMKEESRASNREEHLGIVSLKIFNVLSAHDIRLQVLDVTALPFHLYSRPEDLQHAFANALEASAPSLRELAMRVTPICVKAVSQVTLPKLEVAHLELFDLDGESLLMFGERSTEQMGKYAEAFMHALRALEGHTDRIANKTTLRELRLTRLEKAPCIHNDEACRGLFQAVQILKLDVVEYEGCNNYEIANFMALFPSLRSLHWHGGAIARNLFMIHAACPRLEELHLHHNPRIVPLWWRSWPDFDSYTFKDACLAYHGKLRSFAVHPALTAEELMVLGENSPALEHIDMQVSRENMVGLSCLLGTHCRQLKKLEITLPRSDDDDVAEEEEADNHEAFVTKDWRELAESIRSASDELRELSVHGDEYHCESHCEAVVEFASDVLEFFGERAQEFHLVVPIRTDDMKVTLALLCRVINECVIHSKMLRRLRLNFEGDSTRILNDEDEKAWYAKLLNGMKQLENLPHLHTIDLWGMEDHARKMLDSSGI